MYRNQKIIALDSKDLALIPPEEIEVVFDCNQKKDIKIIDPTREQKPSIDEKKIYAKLVLDREPVRHSRLPYQPLRDVNKLKKVFGLCSTRELSPDQLLKDKGKIVTNRKGLKVLRLPKGTVLFKGTRYFNETKLDPSGNEIPFMWVGSPLVATTYAERFHGAIMVYRTNVIVDLLLLNAPNCQKMYDMTPWNLHENAEFSDENVLQTKYRTALELKFGVGISLTEQIKRVRALKSEVDQPENPPIMYFQTRRLSRFTYCDYPEKTRGFGNMKNDVNVARFVYTRRKELGVDGWFSPETYSAFHCALTEEVLIFPTCVDILPNHPLFWKHWLQYLPINRLPTSPFDLNHIYTELNRGMQIFKYVTDCEDKALTIKRIPSNSQNMLSYLTYHVFNLENPNALINKQTSLANCASLIKKLDPDVVSFQIFPIDMIEALRSSLLSYHICEQGHHHSKTCIVVLIAKRITENPPSFYELLSTSGRNPSKSVLVTFGQYRIVSTAIEDISSYVHSFEIIPMRRFVEAHHFNIEHRSLHITAILYQKPTVILGSLGLLDNETEIKQSLSDASFSIPEYMGKLVDDGTTSDCHVEDFILIKRQSSGYIFKSVPFSQSPHKPVIGYFDEGNNITHS